MRAAGLHGSALAYAQQNASNDELAALLADPQMLRQYQRLYGVRERVAGGAGQLAAMQRFGNELAASRKELEIARHQRDETNDRLKAVERKLEQIRKENKTNSDDNATKTSKGMNATAAAASRKGGR